MTLRLSRRLPSDYGARLAELADARDGLDRIEKRLREIAEEGLKTGSWQTVSDATGKILYTLAAKLRKRGFDADMSTLALACCEVIHNSRPAMAQP